MPPPSSATTKDNGSNKNLIASREVIVGSSKRQSKSKAKLVDSVEESYAEPPLLED